MKKFKKSKLLTLLNVENSVSVNKRELADLEAVGNLLNKAFVKGSSLELVFPLYKYKNEYTANAHLRLFKDGHYIDEANIKFIGNIFSAKELKYIVENGIEFKYDGYTTPSYMEFAGRIAHYIKVNQGTLKLCIEDLSGVLEHSITGDR